jgi:SAM-dependent methyltransferase
MMEKIDIQNYWDNRYLNGGTSGNGSRGLLLEWKSEILNSFIKRNNVKHVIEIGCGDGYLAERIKVQKYEGFDISSEAVKLCKSKSLKNKKFDLVEKLGAKKSELVLSIDVLFHCLTKELLEDALNQIFEASTKYVIIYAYDHEPMADERFSSFYKPQKFTSVISALFPGWELNDRIEQKYKVQDYGVVYGSYSDFYMYEKKC